MRRTFRKRRAAERNCAIYRCVLKQAGFPLGPTNGNVSFAMNAKVYLKFHEERLERHLRKLHDAAPENRTR